jgi:hypothetical protein
MIDNHLGREDDEALLFPLDDMLRYSRGELPPEWLSKRMDSLLRRLKGLPREDQGSP